MRDTLNKLQDEFREDEDEFENDVMGLDLDEDL